MCSRRPSVSQPDPVLRIPMSPDDGSVFVADATWQDEPRLLASDVWAGTWAPSLVHPTEPPFPGVRVRCARVPGESSSRPVMVECWLTTRPLDLKEVFSTVIEIAEHGATVEGGSASSRLWLPAGCWALSVWVADEKPEENFTVAFCFRSM